MRILVVEDDAVLSEGLHLGLSRAGYQVDVARDGESGLDMALARPYGAIVLDIMLPKLDGWAVCRQVREHGVAAPILMLTARDAVDDRVKGLDSGADDYLPKPFDYRELLARLRALLRRESARKDAVIRVADLELDPVAHTVKRSGEDIRLTPREFSLLEALARNAGRTLTRDVILERVWNDEETLSNTVNFHVASLRKKLDAGHKVKLVQTVHGLGYRLEPHEEDPS